MSTALSQFGADSILQTGSGAYPRDPALRLPPAYIRHTGHHPNMRPNGPSAGALLTTGGFWATVAGGVGGGPLSWPGLAIFFGGETLPIGVARDRAQRLLGWLEGFHDRLGIGGSGRQPGLQVHAHELDAGRSAEGNWRLVGKRDLEEVADHRRRDVASSLAMPERRWIVEAN